MRKEKPKTNAQLRRIFGLAKPQAELRGMKADEQIEETIFCNIERNPRISDLTWDEANAVIKALGGDPFPAYGNSRRNVNYKKQQAGIKTIETDAHLQLIEELAAKLGWDEARLRGFCQRQIKRDSPTTTEEGNKVVEGLKAMAKRDGVIQFPQRRTAGGSPAKQPSFRRVA